MTTKQQILDQIKADNTDEETISELTALVETYPEELDAGMVEELVQKVDQYTADNALLEKAYADIESDLDDYVEDVTSAAESGLRKTAQEAHRDMTFAQELLAQE